MKRIVNASILFVLALILCVFVACASFETPNNGDSGSDGVVYQLSENGSHAIVVGYVGTATDVVIANSFENMLVKEIAKFAFYENNYITSVTIPSSVTTIGCGSFSNCKALTKVIMGENVSLIDIGAFSGCSALTSINIPDSVKSIADAAFSSCNSMIKVSMGENVTRIGQNVFYNCNALTVYYGGANLEEKGWAKNWNSSCCPVVLNCKYNEVATDGYIYTVLGGVRYALQDGRAKVVRQPLNIKTANIPDAVTYKDIVYNVTKIEECAFEDCEMLVSVIISSNVVTIESFAFNDCELLTIYCEATSKPNGWYTSWNSSHSPVVWNCNENDIADDGYIYTIVDEIRYALRDEKAKVILQSQNVVTANIPSTIKHKDIDYAISAIEDKAFYDSISLASVTIGEEVETIGKQAFWNCNSLINIDIPKNVTVIGDGAFYSCDLLKNLNFNGTITEWNLIKKGEAWNHNVSASLVKCSDGNVKF